MCNVGADPRSSAMEALQPELLRLVLRMASEGRRYRFCYVPYGDGEQCMTVFVRYPMVPAVCKAWHWETKPTASSRRPDI